MKRHGISSHSTVISPIASTPAADWGGGASPLREPGEDLPIAASGDTTGVFEQTPSSTKLSELCHLVGATPSDLLRLETSSDGVRGLYVTRRVERDEVLLRVPLSSCLRDDDPPSWLGGGVKEEATTRDSPGGNQLDPSGWPTRLAASLVELQLANKKGDTGSDTDEGKGLWLASLPDRKLLRASLPVHWSEDVLYSARCTALELAVDSAYFARADAVSDLVGGLKARRERQSQDANDEEYNEEDLQTLCHDALDIIQTRSCRVERRDGVQWGPPLRILAPVFDFINHGSARCSDRDGCANASFGLEGGGIADDASNGSASLVVRATTTLEEGNEVLLDYGDSARPAWKCLASYGFVPEYDRIPLPGTERGGGEESDEEVGAEVEEDENVAEVYMDGTRYEVGPSTVPYEMAEAAAASQEQTILTGTFFSEPLESVLYDDNQDSDLEDTLRGGEGGPSDGKGVGGSILTPAVALRIAKRVSDVAFQLLLEPDVGPNNGTDEETITAENVHAARLAASLRWSQHQILLACAVGLRDYVARHKS